MTTDHRVDLQPSFVLHLRPYRDTSAIVDLLTRDYGRVAVVAKGIRSAKSKQRGLLQTFFQVEASWLGKGELKTLTGVEPVHHHVLSSTALVGALYVNELILRVLPTLDPCESLYHAYTQLLQVLRTHDNLEVALRVFEKSMLEALGYELNLLSEANTGSEIENDAYYYYLPEHGPVRAKLQSTGLNESFCGRHLLAFARDDFDDPATLAAAKRITRLALKPLIGDRPLKSRELYLSMKRQQTVETEA
ncbi:MAG: DNA repair protein RecO [Gammaproteobacteria bacterium]|nr:DNA repair protein RecO [Gammaproteobacteria bacterium]